jgi:hypothetical protein
MACEAKGSEQAREQERMGRYLLKERRDFSMKNIMQKFEGLQGTLGQITTALQIMDNAQIGSFVVNNMVQASIFDGYYHGDFTYWNHQFATAIIK